MTYDAPLTFATEQPQQPFEFKYAFINSLCPRKQDGILGTSALTDSLQFKQVFLNCLQTAFYATEKCYSSTTVTTELSHI